MSILTNELNYIFDWLEYKGLEFFDCYNLGLSRKQIDESTKELPFKFSEEIYELYEWRNGSQDPDYGNNWCKDLFFFSEQLFSHEPIPFYSLQESVSNYHDLCKASQETSEEGSDFEFWNKKWFPFASFENKRILYVVVDLDPSPVYLWDIDFNPSQIRAYKSLTSMVSMIAECCKSDVYKLVPYEYGEEDEMIIRIDEEKLDLEKAIYQKYNL
jgi:hypothetical protein